MKFKVGDRVRVYGVSRNLEAVSVVTTITKVLPTGQLYTDEATSYTKDFDLSMVHPKQCRKLAPKRPPRRIWMRQTNGNLIGPTRAVPPDATTNEYDLGNWVEFVEVRRKK